MTQAHVGLQVVPIVPDGIALYDVVDKAIEAGALEVVTQVAIHYRPADITADITIEEKVGKYRSSES